MLPPFDPYPKIPRWSGDVIITEKIDGTNATIYVGEDGQFAVASRNRWITPEDDNFGFARWAHSFEDDLRQLGPGWHRGEWWGPGIQRTYGLAEKKFSLFHTFGIKHKPDCVDVVPKLYEGPLKPGIVEDKMSFLAVHGSLASPGFMRPEGIIVYHTRAQKTFKKTFEHDQDGKEAKIKLAA